MGLFPVVNGCLYVLFLKSLYPELGKHLTPLDITYAMSFAMFAVYGSISLITHLVSNDPIELFRPLADPVIVGCLLALSIGPHFMLQHCGT